MKSVWARRRTKIVLVGLLLAAVVLGMEALAIQLGSLDIPVAGGTGT